MSEPIKPGRTTEEDVADALLHILKAKTQMRGVFLPDMTMDKLRAIFVDFRAQANPFPEEAEPTCTRKDHAALQAEIDTLLEVGRATTASLNRLVAEEAEPQESVRLDGRNLPGHAVMWAVVNGLVCRKQHTDNLHEWEHATFSPAWCFEPAPMGYEKCERPYGHGGNHEAGLGLTVWVQGAPSPAQDETDAEIGERPLNSSGEGEK